MAREKSLDFHEILGIFLVFLYVISLPMIVLGKTVAFDKIWSAKLRISPKTAQETNHRSLPLLTILGAEALEHQIRTGNG